jgi:signal transduction histidine kinase
MDPRPRVRYRPLSERQTIQSKILLPFILFSFLAIVVVVLLVAKILSQQIDTSTSKEILAYQQTIDALLKEKQQQTVQYANLFAQYASSAPGQETSVLYRTMDISHMDLLMNENVRIDIEPRRFLQSDNKTLRELVSRGMRGEHGTDLIYKVVDGRPRLDFDVVVPFQRGKHSDFVLLGFSFDHRLLRGLKAKINSDLFVLQNDQVIASSFQGPSWDDKIKAKVTPALLRRILGGGESILEKVYLDDKEYKAVFAPLRVNGTNKAAYGLIMSTNDLVQAKRRVLANYVAVSMVILVVLTLINFVIISAISRPLKEMASLADLVAQGDLTHRIQVDSKDELATLVTSFNNMVAALRKQRDELDFTIKQLIHQEKLASLGELAAGVAHEVGNPLSIIVGYSKWLYKRCQYDEQREPLKQVIDAAQRIDELNKRLLMYSRPGPQQQKSVDLNRVIEDALGMVEHQFKEEKEYRVVRRLSPTTGPIMGNPDRLQQVFINLFNNARQAMPAGGRLTVSSEELKGGRGVLVKVADTGGGIDPQHLSRVFDPFFTTKAPDKGTGLGLSITHRITTDHGGRIWVESRLGAGATFFLEFPYPGHSVAEEADQAPRDAGHAT